MSGELAAYDVTLVRADNPSPLTLTGTNTWVIGRWVVDPGPLLDAHLDAVVAAVGAAEGIAITHDHADHVEGMPGVLHDRRVDGLILNGLDDPPAEARRVAAWARGAHLQPRTARVGAAGRQRFLKQRS